MANGNRQAVKSANRVLDLFELLGRWGQNLSHTDIAAALKIPKSSLSQLLPNLVDRGYVEFVASTKGYRLGEKLTLLAGEVSQSKNLPEIVRPVLEKITAQTKESSALNVLSGNMSEVVASANSSLRLVSHMRDGDLAPLHTTSGGKAILAFMPDAMFEEYIKRVKLKPITKNTITSAAELRRQVANIRRDKMAYAFGEFTIGIVGMAVPIFSTNGRILGSINIAMPAVRHNPKVRAQIAEALQHAVETVQQLGFSATTRQKAGRKKS